MAVLGLLVRTVLRCATQQRLAAKRFIALCSAVLILGALGVGPAAAEEDDTALFAGIEALIAAHNAASTLSLIGDPGSAFAAETVVLGTNLALKFVQAPLSVPSDIALKPNSANSCTYDFTLPQSAVMFQDLFGLIKLSGGNALTGIPNNWGVLGTPSIWHANSEVLLTVEGPNLPISDTSQQIRMPAGSHQLTWRADTLFDPAFDLALPSAMLAYSGYSKLKSTKTLPAATAGDVSKATKEYSVFKRAGMWLIDKLRLGVQQCSEKCIPLAIKKGIPIIADRLTDFEQVGATHTRTQNFTVYDVWPPTLQIGTSTRVFEAGDFGGVARERVQDQLNADVTANDACNRPVTLSNDAPALFPLGDTVVTWKVSDLGPINVNGDVNTVTKTQTIRVRDTQAPIMVAPPGKVIEVPAGVNSLNAAEVDLGVPRVVDLADPMPSIQVNAPASYPVNSRTPVVWSASDHSSPTPNTTSKTQLITVKRAGTNTAPTVTNLSVQTLTSQPIDLVLRGTDTDVIGGRVDPLSFKIVDPPDHGEFVAPLYPFFIDDYRTTPAGPYGEAFATNNYSEWLFKNVCQQNQEIRRDWPFNPRFVSVSDSGEYYLIDQYVSCNPSGASGGGQRISKWDRDGNFLDQINYNEANNTVNDTLVADRDGFLYTVSLISAGGSSRSLGVSQIDPNYTTGPNTTTFSQRDYWRFTFNDYLPPAPAIFGEGLRYGRVDSQHGIIYVTDGLRIYVYDIRPDIADPEPNYHGEMLSRFLGVLDDGRQTLAGCGGTGYSGYAMEVDSRGALYVTDSCSSRIVKFEPSHFDDDGNFVMGALVGWMGRCESSTNKACNEQTQTTRGYSCTDETCTRSSTAWHGDGPGQFSGPSFIAMGPNDVLYVADTGNARVQRFGPDGTFGGEARSTGSGINQGDHPSFVLGNMGYPKNVSVNSTNFYVVDADESFIHVFETSPFKEIREDQVTVTYVSDFDFHSGTDTFLFGASDGLADSNSGRVSVQVERNFRPPEAFDQALSTDEDQSLTFKLEADDPDGILGVDFNGLDTLTYTIVAGPGYGTLTGSGDSWTYLPQVDFYGEDSFTFKVNDGREDSNTARVAIVVRPVDDEPRVDRVGMPERIGLGFPTLFTGQYWDDGTIGGHFVYVDWGDGSSASNGNFVDPDGPEGPQPAELVGIKLIEAPARNGDGIALGQHTYVSTGERTARFCMLDQGDQGFSCMEQTLTVEHLVNLELQVAAAAAQIKAGNTEVTVTVTNMLPAGVAGLDAGRVRFAQDPTDALQVVGFVAQPNGCTAPGGRLVCDIGNLAPGTSVSAIVKTARKAAAFNDVDAFFTVTATTDSRALQDAYTQVAAIKILADPAQVDTDRDRIPDLVELAHGLNPNNAADAAQDKDKDGLTNAREYAIGSDISNPDTDGDGLLDGKDPIPLSEFNPTTLVPVLKMLLD